MDRLKKSKGNLARLERVQHKFLIWLAHRTNAHYDSLEYDHLLKLFMIRTLYARRVATDVVFLAKVFRGFISSSYLLQSFSLHVPSRVTRNAAATLFHVPRGRVNCVANGLFVRCPRAVNSFLLAQPLTDFVCDPVGVIKRRLALYTEAIRI